MIRLSDERQASRGKVWCDVMRSEELHRQDAIKHINNVLAHDKQRHAEALVTNAKLGYCMH